MTMTPTEFHDLMAQALAGGPSSDLAAVERDIATGRRLLSRRRRTTGALVLACVVALGLAIVAGTGDGGRPDAIDGSHQLGKPEILAACRDGGSAGAVEAIFGRGEPEIMAINRQPDEVEVALQPVDDNAWSHCTIDLTRLRHGLPRGWMEAYRTKRDNAMRVPNAVQGPWCPSGRQAARGECRTFRVSMIDRLPPEVAAVEIRTVDGVSRKYPTHQGYFAFVYVGAVPDGLSMPENVWKPEVEAIDRVTYLDRRGRPLAAITAYGPRPKAVGALPTLYDFPTQRGKYIN